MNQLFDFSQVRDGQVLTRIIYNLWINETRVLRLTEDKVHCDVLVDTLRQMSFDRRTGVNVDGPKFGLIVNRAGQGHEFVEQLKRDLQNCLEDENLPQETREALRLQFAHDW